MSRQSKTRVQMDLQDVLNTRMVDDLKRLIALLPIETKPSRKAELIVEIVRHMRGDYLLDLWEQLDHLQQQAVAETIHHSGGFFDAVRFRAKHGSLPNFGTKDDRSFTETPSLLRLFIHPGGRYSSEASIIPGDLQQWLLVFVSKPEAFVLQSTETLTEHGDVPLTQRNTEQEALVDCVTLLRLIDKGKIAVSNKTFQPATATVKTLVSQLSNDDFYPLKPKQHKWEQEIGPIKAFAWPLLVQAGKLAELSGKKLTLTKAGRTAMSQSSPATLRLIWRRWLKTKLLDEFSRINTIKGQAGKGKRSMTAATDRRVIVAEALAKCPVGRWVTVDNLWCFMQAADLSFEVTRDPWHLYIVDPHYGSLGYQDYHDWSVLQGRYVLCLLFEYAASLGIIDVAFVEPEDARQDYRHQWGADDLSFLSRYDGLQAIRLTSLGAYCLGLTEEYRPSEGHSQTRLSVLPSLQVNISNTLAADERLLLENYAELLSETQWRLNRSKALLAVENGHQIEELREFLQTRDDQPLPETVESFITTTHRQGQALRYQGTVLLIECTDAQLADLLATGEHTKHLCQRSGKCHVVISPESEKAFRKAIHQMSYGMPKV